MKTPTKQFYKHKISNFLNVQKIVTIHYQEPEKNYVSKEETHNFWEINYADKKDFFVHIDGEKHLVKQGEILFIKPNCAHYVECHGSEANIFIISFDCRSEGMDFFANKKYVVPEECRYLLQNIMTEATETFVIPDFDPDLNKLELQAEPNLGGEQVIKNSLELLLIYLLRGEYKQNASAPEFFISKISSSSALQDEIVYFLSSKVYDKLSLDEICAELHYGKTYLCSFYKSKTGTSIYQTYLKLKIDEAKKLIRRKESFATIAGKLYFDSVSHFNYAFKKVTGKTPGEYKESIKTK
jgi:AraC-like DNA-binding protein